MPVAIILWIAVATFLSLGKSFGHALAIYAAVAACEVLLTFIAFEVALAWPSIKAAWNGEKRL